MPHESRITAGLLALTLLAFCSCAEERPTQPGPTRYRVYADFTGHRIQDSNGTEYDAYTHRLYIYDIDSSGLTLADSINMDRESEQLATSPDGRFLYRQSLRIPEPYQYDWQLEKWEVRSKTLLWSVPGYWGICQLNGGAWLLQPEGPGEATLRAAADGSVLRTFPDTLEVGWGPISGTKVAVTTKEDFGERLPWEVLHVLDVATGEIYGRWVPYLAAGGPLRVVSYIRLHPDGRRVAVIGARAANFDSWFAVGDVLTGQTLLEHRLVYGAGQISISDDGRYAIATDPSWFLIYDSSPSLDIFDLTTNTHLRRFGGSDGNPEDGYMGYVAQSAFVPGANSVVTGPDPGVFKGIGAVGLIDLLQLRLVDYAFSPLHYTDAHGGITGAYMGGIAVGPRP